MSCNDDMITIVLHINEYLAISDFRKKAGRPLYRTVRCRYKTLLSVLSMVRSFLNWDVKHYHAKELWS